MDNSSSEQMQAHKTGVKPSKRLKPKLAAQPMAPQSARSVSRKRVQPPKQQQSVVQCNIAAKKRGRPFKVQEPGYVTQSLGQSAVKPVTLPIQTDAVKAQTIDTAVNIINTWLLLLLETRDGPESPPPTIVQYCRQQFWWKSTISLASSVERYEATLQHVLNTCTSKNGKLSKGQQQVLEVYTRDVCAQHLHIATAVWAMFTAL